VEIALWGGFVAEFEKRVNRRWNLVLILLSACARFGALGKVFVDFVIFICYRTCYLIDFMYFCGSNYRRNK
jgi:hypothetical protein